MAAPFFITRLGLCVRFSPYSHFLFNSYYPPEINRIHYPILYTWTPTNSALAYPLSRLLPHFDVRYASARSPNVVKLPSWALAIRSQCTLRCFAGSDYEAPESIVELEQAKRAPRDGDDDGCGGSEDEDGGEGVGEGVVSVSDWGMEGRMGVIDVGETAVVHFGKTPPCSEPSEDHRTVT